MRLDPRRIDKALHRPLLNRLITFGELDALKEFFAAVGVEGLEGHFENAVDKAIADSKLDKATALLEIFDPPEEEWLGFPLRFLKRKVEGGEALEILEREARAAVDEDAVTFAIDLLQSQWPSLGILVARGVAPLASLWDRGGLFEALGRARDRLDLPAAEPTEDMHDLWGWEEGLDDDEHGATGMLSPPSPPSASQRDDSAWHELEAKEAELGRLRQEMSALREQLESHTHEVVSSGEPVPVVQPAEGSHEPSETRIAELKERVARMKGELNQRHAERNQLKRQLEREQKRADLLEAERRKSADTTSQGQGEDESGAPEPEASGPLPFRFPVLTKRFRASLQHTPESTKRRTVVLVSRIAAGDQAAFRGTRRLEVDRTIWRRRVGRDYRMLFRLTDDELEVLDIVHRQGLERTVRELT